MSDVINFLEKIAVDPLLVANQTELINAVAGTDFEPVVKSSLASGEISSLVLVLKARQDLVCGVIPAEEPEEQPDEEPEQEPENESSDKIIEENNLKKIA